MATYLKCKKCGGDIEIQPGMTVGTCLYCKSVVTLPRIDTDKKSRLFQRADQYFLNCEFDKAYDSYKAIVDEDEQEAEGYWGMLLAEYGVEYVEDPKTGQRIPSCHRTHVQSILNTVNYDLARKYADAESRLLYQDEAEAIDRIQKKIISISTKEEPYDVFLCYKESEDDTGERTKDSVLAFDLYEALTQKGIRVFFSRITLEDKLGQDYEPYIYSALRSARVMLLVTTSTEHAQAVWVKNEWKRFLSFMEEGEDKTFIPVYQDMSPYELPSELAKYQGQDLAKVGATQDLIHAVEKVLGKKQAENKINNTQLNELIADKQRREKQAVRSRRMIGAITVIVVTILLGAVSLTNAFTNGYWNFGAYQLLERYYDIAITFAIVTGIALLIDLITLIYCMARGYCRKFSEIGFSVGFVIFSGAILYMEQNGFYMYLMIVPYIGNVLWLLLLSIFAFRQHEKSWGASNLAIIGICGLAVLVSSVGQVEELGNGRNPLAEQIKITSTYANLREEPDETTEKLGELYKNQYYDVLGIEETEDYIWYEIETASGVHGYIADVNCEEIEMFDDLTYRNYFDILDSVQELKETGDNDTAQKILGQLSINLQKVEFTEEEQYEIAVTVMELEGYAGAYELFTDLNDYMNSQDLAEECRLKALHYAVAGEYVYFGHYEIDGDVENGDEFIRWLVLDRNEDAILLISEKILAEHVYGGSSWAESTLRTWLNETFLKDAFSEQEAEQILPVNLANSIGEDTIDNIFLLSTQDAQNYFAEDDDRRAAQTTEVHGEEGILYSFWWLRTLKNSETAYFVQGGGEISTTTYFSNESRGVRPALWLSTEGLDG